MRFALLLTAIPAPAEAQNRGVADPDRMATAVEARLTDAERLSLLMGDMTLPAPGTPVRVPEGVPQTAGYVPGVLRLGIPAQIATDASLGVTNPLQARPGDFATAMPSGLALASSFDPVLSERVGITLGKEARGKGFNVLLGGGVNLTRDPRNGRNFEYLGEDPLLAGTLVGHVIRGTQTQGVVSTIKHFVLNAQETQRQTANAVIDPDALRESDLLAFEIGIEIGQPGAVMCAYNRVNGPAACGNGDLLDRALKHDWGFKGWVMSDWGAVGGPDFILRGLDQQAGSQLDQRPWFGSDLKAQIESGQIPHARVSDAARRIIRSLFAVGAAPDKNTGRIDYAEGARVALDAARRGIVLLKNDGALPIRPAARTILVVGGRADFGVLSGGGSSQVTPSNGAPYFEEWGGDGIGARFNRHMFMPGSPLAALRHSLPDHMIIYDGGYSAEAAAAKAAQADLVVVFATKWETETADSPSLDLPQGQDHLIEAVAAANPHVVVVLETGNPVTMPWLGKVSAVVEAWYPGQEGGRAIAEVLAGQTNPSGRLPITFPASLGQEPRAAIPGLQDPESTPVEVPYPEGADAGYRRYIKRGITPLFPFGYGLSYTTFSYSSPRIVQGHALRVSFSVTNTGESDGDDIPQVYLVQRNGERLRRLVGFQRVELKHGASQPVTLDLDPRLLADFRDGKWMMPAGHYSFAIGRSALDLDAPIATNLLPRQLKP